MTHTQRCGEPEALVSRYSARLRMTTFRDFSAQPGKAMRVDDDIAAWIAEAEMAYAWLGREPPPLEILMLLAARTLGLTRH